MCEILVPYFKAGLENNEFCVWVTSPPFSDEDAEAALRQAMPDFDRFRQGRQIEILRHSDWYLKGGEFSQQQVLEGWLDRLEQALRRGFEGLRLTGNTFWLEKRDWKAFIDYEEAVNAVIGKHRMIALCTYSLEKCGGREILDVVRNHQFALIKSDHGWDLLESADARRAREMQRESEARYRSLFNSMNEAFALHEVIFDEKGTPVDYRFLDINPAFERLTGLSRADAVGRTVRQVLPDIQPSLMETCGRVALTGEPVHFEHRSERLGRTYEVMAHRPQPGRLAATFQDVTERRQDEEKLAWIASFPELNPNPVVEVDLTSGSVNYLNPAARRLFPDLVEKQLRHPWLAGVYPIAEKLRAKGSGMEIREVLIGGSCYQQSLNLAFNDRRLRVYSIDVTSRRGAEEALRRSNARLDLLAETAGLLLRSDSPQQVVDSLCSKVTTFLNCDAFFNFLVDEQRNCLHLNACGGIPEEEARRIEWLDYGAAVCGCAARDGSRIVCENIPEVPDPRTELVRSYGIKAYACHPLISQGKVLGTLSFGTRRRTGFTDDELSLMKAVADQVAIAIDRKHAREALQRANEELERRVLERTSQLQEKTRFLEASFQHSLDCLVFLDKQFNFIRVNDAYARACGRDPSEFPGHNHFGLYPHAENRAIFEDVVRTKTPYQASAKPFSFPDHPEWGVTYWDWTLNPVLAPDGEVDFLVFSLKDVTRREHGIEQLREASRYARSLLESSLDPLVTISEHGKITDVNEATELVTGVNRGLLIGSNFSDCFTEAEKANTGYQRVISEGLVRDFPLTIRHASGRTTEVLYNATVYRNEAGQAQGVFAAARDVTELRAAERRRNFTNALLELFASKSSIREYLDSVVQVIRDWSDCQALGIRITDDGIGIPYQAWAGFEPGFLDLERYLSLAQDPCCCVRAVTQAIEPQDQPALTPGGSFRFDNSLEFIDRLSPTERSRYRGNCMKQGFASLAVIPIRHQNRILGVIHLADRRPGHFPQPAVEFIESMTPLIGEAILRFRAEAELGRYHDHLEVLVKQRTTELEAANAQLQLEISERLRAEQSVRKTAEELERSNRDLEQFAYVSSHDLQEPLRAVAGYVELLRHRYNDKLDDKAHQYINGASDGAARMQRLIVDLLAFSRVGTQGMKFERVSLKTALDVALANLKASIHEAGAKVTSDPLPVLHVDATQMAQLFQNLVGNAIKFRSKAPCRIHVGAGKQPGHWLISVQDNGIGIDPQYAKRIFMIFQRLHTRLKYPGTGVGLAICKRIVERHGGNIWVESQPGIGSTFHFTVPLTEEISS